MHEQEHQHLMDEGLEYADFDFSVYEKWDHVYLLTNRNLLSSGAHPTGMYQMNDSLVLIQLRELLLRKGYVEIQKCPRLMW